jgi:hypothetical protein
LGPRPGRSRGQQSWGRSRPACLSGRLRQRRGTRIPAAQSAAGIRREAAARQGHGASHSLHKGNYAVCFESELYVRRGERCSRVSVPPPCSPLSISDRRNQGRRRRPCDSPADGCYGRSCGGRRGSTLTRVPASSIDRSAPRSMSSRCPSSASPTTLTTTSESRS